MLVTLISKDDSEYQTLKTQKNREITAWHDPVNHYLRDEPCIGIGFNATEAKIERILSHESIHCALCNLFDINEQFNYNVGLDKIIMVSWIMD